jgi:LacI family transcriptional regulator
MAIKGRPGLSQKKREEILALAKEMNYRPNFLSRGLKGGKTQTIGLIIGGPYLEAYGRKIEVVENVAASHGYRVFACFHGGDIDREKIDIQDMLDRRVDGLIVNPVERTDGLHFLPLIERRFPLVIMSQQYTFAANYIQEDFAGGALSVIRHLVQIGRKKIAFVCGSNKAFSFKMRLKGWRQGCEEAGMDFDSIPFYAKESTPQCAYELTEQLIASKRPFDALITSSDSFAVVAMKVMQKHGIKVPDDVAVIGHDDDKVSSFLSVSLSTTRFSARKMGETAVNTLLKHIQDPSAPPEKVLVGAELVVRESTGGEFRFAE